MTKTATTFAALPPPFPSSRKKYITGGRGDIRVPIREISLSDASLEVDGTEAFYPKLGWRLDADVSFDNGFRVVQFSPPEGAQ
jgi:hypothetical protein